MNIAKDPFAHRSHNTTAILTDVSGGVLATRAGWEGPNRSDIRDVLEKNYAPAGKGRSDGGGHTS